MRPAYFRPPIKMTKGNAPSSELVSLFALRGKILLGSLCVFLLLGLITFFIALPGKIEQKQWGYIIGFGIVLVWMVAVTLITRIQYRVRAVSLVLAIILLGLVSFTTEGLYGSGRLYLLAVPIVTGLVFSAQSSIIALIISLAIFAVAGFVFKEGIIPISSITSDPGSMSLSAWLLSGVSLVLVSTSITLSLAAILHGLEIRFEKEKHLTGELDIERARQDHRVLQRTQEMERRLGQLRAALDVTRTFSLNLKPEQLLPRIVNLVEDEFNYYFSGIFLIDDQNEFAVLQAGSGEAGAAMLKAGHRLALDETSAVGWSILHQQAKIAVDVGFEAVRFSNPLLPLTRSELALPLVVGKESRYEPTSINKLSGSTSSSELGGGWVLGALVVQSAEAKAFDQDEITLLQGIANSLASALVNAKLLQELEGSLEETQALNRQYLLESWKDVTRQVENRQFSTRAEQTTPMDLSQEPGGATYRYPLKLRDQEIGQLTLDIDREGLSDEENAFIEAVTTQAAVALENVRLLEKNQRQASYERLLSDISRKARSSTDLDTILRVTIQELGRVLGASDGIIRLDIPAGEEEVPL